MVLKIDGAPELRVIGRLDPRLHQGIYDSRRRPKSLQPPADGGSSRRPRAGAAPSPSPVEEQGVRRGEELEVRQAGGAEEGGNAVGYG